MDEEPRIEDPVEMVLTNLPCSVTLPAGAGKTELIAASVAQVAKNGGTSLVLTHTHAGVDSLRRRMKKFGVRNEQVLVRTIDSWSYDLISHFPILSDIRVPATPDWDRSDEYHCAAGHAIRSKAVHRMLKVSYSNVFIDEYQDCTLEQHELVLALKEALPVAVFGDPLQSLFNFGKNRPVRWDAHVVSNFESVNVQYRPRRWEPHHEDLGEWLIHLRQLLFGYVPVDLRSAPVHWIQREDSRSFVKVCYEALKLEGSVAILGRFRADCVSAASALKGTYSVMEAIDETLPVRLSEIIDSSEGSVVAQKIVEFAIDCSAGLATHISAAKRKQLGEGRSFTTTKEALKPAYEAVRNVRADPTLANVITALAFLRNMPGVKVYCLEIWDEIVTAVSNAKIEGFTVTDALNRMRSHKRAVGRKPSSRIVTRPLLVKGLEYDHVIILNPENYSAQELYVALTRGSKSVTVISETPILPTAKVATS